MGILKNEYKSFLDDIEKNIKDPQDLEYIKGRFASFLDVILDQMDYIMDYKKEQIEKLENTQKELDDKMGKMQQVIDNIEKAVTAETKDEEYKKGIELVLKQFKDVLNSRGVIEIETIGKTFDPELHEAVSSIQDDTKGEKEIVQEYRKGYKIGDRVIRHSMVVVAN